MRHGVVECVLRRVSGVNTACFERSPASSPIRVFACSQLYWRGVCDRMGGVKTRLLSGASSERLLLLFAGWGMDVRPFEGMARAFDTLVVWDYRELSGLPPLPGDRPVDVVAWSMGVWAAGQVLARGQVVSATAVNGTPWPIDEVRGIPPAVFEGTLAGFGAAGLMRFRRRMCGGAAGLKAFEAVAPERSVEELGEELAALGRAIGERPAGDFVWTRAVACREDRIFPLAAQQAAFPEALVRPGAHWAPEVFGRLLRGEEP